MNNIKILFFVIALSLIQAATSISWIGSKTFYQDVKEQDKKKKKEKKKNSDAGKGSEGAKKGNLSNDLPAEYKILETWNMPGVLTEVSGITWYGANKIAAIQDELGIIFIYNLLDKKIEKEIPFGINGDYEGITLVKNVFYVLRADGTLFEIPVNGKGIKTINTHLTVENDTEGLCYDPIDNQLLISLKGPHANYPGKKVVFSFDLNSQTLSSKPVIMLDLSNQLLNQNIGKKKNNEFQPSDLTINPKTSEIYFTDGSNLTLVKVGNDGKVNSLVKLLRPVFMQPEGLLFSPEGDLYISTEGTKESGKIVKIELNQK